MFKNPKRYFSNETKEKPTVGKLSNKLRKALGLEPDMLPFWIYRMRVVGYPPAWLQAAQSSSLIVFDEPDGCQISINKNSEEGEIEDKLKYNKDSLIEFHGFNVPVPSNQKDDWLILGMPPYQENQQLSEAIKTMSFVEPVPYKRRRFDNNSLCEINNSSNDSSQQVDNDQVNVETETDKQDTVLCKDNENSESKINSEECSKDVSEESPNNDNVSKKMKLVSSGTPVPKSFKPSLPSLEKWSVGMGELLQFENLPNSTGAYQAKMKNIITKIRDRHNSS